MTSLNKKIQGLGYTSFIERDGDLSKLFVGFYETEKEAAIEKLKIDRRFKVNSWVRQK